MKLDSARRAVTLPQQPGGSEAKLLRYRKGNRVCPGGGSGPCLFCDWFSLNVKPRRNFFSLFFSQAQVKARIGEEAKQGSAALGCKPRVQVLWAAWLRCPL